MYDPGFFTEADLRTIRDNAARLLPRLKTT